MKGMNAETGRAVSGRDHLYQSIAKILTTPLATCIKRRAFGSDLFEQVDAPNNGAERTRLYAAIATALMRYEPRLTLTRVQLVTDETTAAGAQIIDIEGYTTETGSAVGTRVDLTTGKTA
ncbi:GPW/gp25 family protein [Burkholderia sp. Bp9015]|uniref:GPW/gp25 family protein n=1 Tax=Burkholderia sp. Bp9015 TaxID=2184563 RepID=UPI000F5A3B62|nr:GPW/gp25 family protein [Burkholderia sp. Bp9015]RQR78688.1 baseplate assembly protein [Burkholderia sp. Bp9015]